MGDFECCHHCQKKQAGCKPTCIDYIIAKAFHEVKRAEQDKQKQISGGLYDQRDKAIRKRNKLRKQCNGNKV